MPGTEPDATYAYDLVGHMLSAVQDGRTLGFGYDALGRLTSTSGPHGTNAYLYDAAGRRTRLTYADGFYVGYDYDVVGNVMAIRENGAASGVGVLATYGYDSLGRRSSVSFGNGTTQTLGFDAASRLTSLTSDMGGTAQDQSVSFGYNAAGITVTGITVTRAIYPIYCCPARRRGTNMASPPLPISAGSDIVAVRARAGHGKTRDADLANAYGVAELGSARLLSPPEKRDARLL